MRPKRARGDGETGGESSEMMTGVEHEVSAAQNGAFGTTAFSDGERRWLQDTLQKKMPPEYIASRPGPFGKSINYVEGSKVVALANEILGFNGWSSTIVDVTVDFIDIEEGGKVTLGISAIVRVTLRDGAFHEDIGYGIAERLNGKGAAFEKAKKEAVTDATKRALRNLGNVLGGCLYDKQFINSLSRYRRDQMRTMDINNPKNSNNLTSADFYSAENIPDQIRTTIPAKASAAQTTPVITHNFQSSDLAGVSTTSRTVPPLPQQLRPQLPNALQSTGSGPGLNTMSKIAPKPNGTGTPSIDDGVAPKSDISFSQCAVEDDLIYAVEEFESVKVLAAVNGNVNEDGAPAAKRTASEQALATDTSKDTSEKLGDVGIPMAGDENLTERQRRARQLQAEERARYREFYKSHT